MPTATDVVLDAGLNVIAEADQLFVTSAEPANYAGIAAVTLVGPVALTPGQGNGDFTLGDGTPSGRALTVAAQNGATAVGSDQGSHVVLATGGGTDVLRYVTEVDSPQSITSGNTVNVGAWSVTNTDPVAA